MLLTLAKPPKSEFDFKTHDYSPTAVSSLVAQYSPKFNGGVLPSQSASASSIMGTPHRGLPPPSAMTLPEPGRGPSISQPMGSLPPAPTQWQGAEDGMKNWLAAKAEEEKRRQEEERTRQEDLRVQQRQIEQSMLRESLQGGVPPHLIPMIFAGMAGGSLANISADMLREHQLELQAAQRQAQVQAQSQLSPELRRETRLIGQAPSGTYGSQPQTPQTVLPPTAILPGQPLPSQPQHAAFSQSPYAAANTSPRARAAQPPLAGAPTSAPRPPPQPSQLPRLATNEMHIQQPPTAPSNVQQLQQTQTTQQEQQSSPSIYFHHWVPPSSQQEKSSSGNPPATPSGKYKASPVSLSRQRAASHASDPDYTSSPKKRKAQGGHTAPPPPTSAPQPYTSPSFSHVSTSSTSTPGQRGHTRARSDASTRGPEGRGSALSRRGTISTHGYAEAGAQHNESIEYRFQPPLRGPEEHQQRESSYHATSLRSEVGGNGQPSQSTYPTETRQHGQHHQLDRGFASSPKREPGGQ